MEDLVGFDSLHLGVAKESRFVIFLMQNIHFSFFSFPSLTGLKLHLLFSLSGVGLGPRDLILFRLPLLRRLPFSIRIFVFVVVQLLLFLGFAHIVRSGFLLVLDELSRAVAQFYPTLGGNGGLGGMNGGFNPPPVPDNSSIFAAASHEAEGPASGGRAPRDFISELKEDTTLCRSYRNACIKQEEIIQMMAQLLLDQGVHIEDHQDIRKGVDLYFTDTMEKTPNYRNKKLKLILNDLTASREKSQYYDPILREIEAQNGPFVPRS